MANLWKIVVFIWENRELLQKVLKEIMDLFKGSDQARVKAWATCTDCSPKLSTLASLGEEAKQHNRSVR